MMIKVDLIVDPLKPILCNHETDKNAILIAKILWRASAIQLMNNFAPFWNSKMGCYFILHHSEILKLGAILQLG